MEADELAQLIVEHLEAIDCGEHFHGPGMLLRLGNLYKENRVINQDYAKAREYYESARIEWGIAVDGMLAELPNR